ncbi:hypothetical protein [Sandaracinus amylolyticus]|uniref:Galactose mutarotase n=1 Tax=Sandaracinus amylolyticus TaxID=927083 RepID=A0A0F6YNH9_9BACT|nr:hypothetical protein [Sandaracinus amylolyticus]AKF11495.1 hypothetical protein DB32_008644 [Sandaracinus amylolyticus]
MDSCDVQGFRAVRIQRGSTTLVVVPALGAKIASIHAAGREWLWTSATIPYRAPIDGASYVETADSGGFDECFPTVSPCTLPGGVTLPDHGELWAVEPEIDARDSTLSARWTGRRAKYVFERRIDVDPSGAVTMRYAATNSGNVRMPFSWSSHPLMPLTNDVTLVLPKDAITRVDAQHDIDLGGHGAEHRWPVIAGHDMTRPAALGRHYATKLFVALGDVKTVGLAVEGARLTAELEGIPDFGLWINHRGWTPFEGGTPYLNFGFEPCIGAPDSLARALEPGWENAHWLAAGETRRWAMRWTFA